MLNRINKRKSEGFTIIEVMIVLAIAGLILLIVFLAVPALQRNSRNTQRKNDVSALIASVNEYESNNSSMPTTCATAVQGAKLGYYTGGCTSTGSGSIALLNRPTSNQGPLTASASNDKVVIVTGATCSTTAAGGTTVAGAHQVALQYLIEVSGTYTPACQGS